MNLSAKNVAIFLNTCALKAMTKIIQNAHHAAILKPRYYFPPSPQQDLYPIHPPAQVPEVSLEHKQLNCGSRLDKAGYN